jgi:NADH-quinone oxidoreductase subunit J
METTLYFIILAAVAVIGGLLTITRSHPLSATLSLVVTLIALAGLYALLSAEFLFVIQILVYAGAIMALMVFVIMLLNVRESSFPKETGFEVKVLLTFALSSPLLLTTLWAIHQHFGDSTFPALSANGFGSIKSVGLELYTQFFFPFEIVSILLLVALVGVVTLAKRRA